MSESRGFGRYLSKDNWNFVLSIGLSFVILVGWTYLVPKPEGGALTGAQRLAQKYFEEAVFQVLFAAAALVVATVLFLLRRYWRRTYAVLEVVFGLAAAVYAANALYTAVVPDDRAKAVVASIAGIYIIVRGLDNWQEGQKLAPPKPRIEPKPLLNIISKNDLRPTQTS